MEFTNFGVKKDENFFKLTLFLHIDKFLKSSKLDFS